MLKQKLILLAACALSTGIYVNSACASGEPAGYYTAAKSCVESAQDHYFYLTAKGGVAATWTSSNWNGYFEGAPIGQPNKNSRLSAVAGGSFGYKFANSPLQLGLTYYYIDNRYFEWQPINGLNPHSEGKIEFYSNVLLLNAYYNIYTGTNFVPYIGLGIGGNVNESKTYWHDNTGKNVFDGNQNRFGDAYNALIGFNYAFSPSWVANLELNYLNLNKTEDIQPILAPTIAEGHRFHVGTATLGITYRF